MLIRTLTLMATLTLAGCDQGFGGFNEGGSSNDPELFGDDTGDDGGENNQNADAPEILDLNLEFDDYPNIGIVLVITAEVSDAQDDLLDGAVLLTITPVSSGETSELVYGINNTDARLEGEAVVMAIQGVSQSEAYDITLQIVDAAGNESEVVEGSI